MLKSLGPRESYHYKKLPFAQAISDLMNIDFDGDEYILANPPLGFYDARHEDRDYIRVVHRHTSGIVVSGTLRAGRQQLDEIIEMLKILLPEPSPDSQTRIESILATSGERRRMLTFTTTFHRLDPVLQLLKWFKPYMEAKLTWRHSTTGAILS